MKKITLRDAIEAVRAEVEAAGPDHVYSRAASGSCVNVILDEDGRYIGSCLIGRAVIRLGAPLTEWQARWDKWDKNTPVTEGPIVSCALMGSGELMANLEEHLDWSFDDGVNLFWGSVQDAQDHGNPWGTSFHCGLDRVSGDHPELVAEFRQHWPDFHVPASILTSQD